MVCDKNLWTNCRYTVASRRKCSLWNNDWNSHLIIVICPHAVHTVVADKKFKESLTVKDSRKLIYSVYQKKGEACSREHGQRRIFSHTRLLQEAICCKTWSLNAHRTRSTAFIFHSRRDSPVRQVTQAPGWIVVWYIMSRYVPRWFLDQAPLHWIWRGKCFREIQMPVLCWDQSKQSNPRLLAIKTHDSVNL